MSIYNHGPEELHQSNIAMIGTIDIVADVLRIEQAADFYDDLLTKAKAGKLDKAEKLFIERHRELLVKLLADAGKTAERAGLMLVNAAERLGAELVKAER